LSHPYYIHNNILNPLVKNGLMGIEARHIKHSKSTVKRFLSLAEEFVIIATGGSDCHGSYKKEPPVTGK
jgi:predicted metal-dependent phosphoesterase TrpH